MHGPNDGPAEGWHYGLDPAIPGMTVRVLSRERHPLGEALRLELGRDDDETVHIQWYIATEISPWAMWATCRGSEVPDREAAIRAITGLQPDD